MSKQRHEHPAPIMVTTYTSSEPLGGVFSTATPGRGPLLQRKCACGGPAGASGECEACSQQNGLQAQLSIGARNDPLEHEADRMADQIAAGPAHAAHGGPVAHVQRAGGELSNNVPSAPASVDQALANAGEPLEPVLRHDMEQRFGHDFSHVRVHSNAAAERSARDVDANAYTVGNHIAFAAGHYTPGTLDGRRLIAHELTHVVQQSGVRASVQRQTGTVPAPKVVPPVAPNPAQAKMIEAARRAAAVRTQVAMFKVRGLNGSMRFQEARELASLKFSWPNPNMEQIGDILANMGGGLNNVDVKVAGPGDPECGNRAGYVRGHMAPIVLCPAFFRSSAESQIRTMVHEMAHVVGIGKADAAEQYLVIFDCDSPAAFESADAWANYVNCMSGQKPDQPPVITPSGRQSTPAAPAQNKPKTSP